jgi:hypothetical protein
LFTIVDPNLQLNQLEAVQHDVAALLEHGFNPPAASAPLPSGDSTPPARDFGPNGTAEQTEPAMPSHETTAPP